MGEIDILQTRGQGTRTCKNNHVIYGALSRNRGCAGGMILLKDSAPRQDCHRQPVIGQVLHLTAQKKTVPLCADAERGSLSVFLTTENPHFRWDQKHIYFLLVFLHPIFGQIDYRYPLPSGIAQAAAPSLRNLA